MVGKREINRNIESEKQFLLWALKIVLFIEQHKIFPQSESDDTFHI